MRRRHPKRFNSVYYQRATRCENDNHINGKERLAALTGPHVDEVYYEIEYPRPEAPKWSYFADLLCTKGKFQFILEVDGDSHLRTNRRRKDISRDIWFWENHGIKTVRFSTDDLTSKHRLSDSEIWHEIDKKLGCDFLKKGVASLFCWFSKTKKERIE